MSKTLTNVNAFIYFTHFVDHMFTVRARRFNSYTYLHSTAIRSVMYIHFNVSAF